MIVNLKSETDLSGFYFIYRGSTSFERKGWYGIAHASEHLFCKNFDDLQDQLQENGISWNAYTSYGVIVYYFTGLESYLAPFRDMLVERLAGFKVTPEDVEKEKKIVLEEYLDSFTDQAHMFFLNYMRRKYGSYSPIGLKEDIENFTYQDFLDFYDVQYKNPDLLINVSKTFEYTNDAMQFTDRTSVLKSEWLPDPNAPLEGIIDSEFTKSNVMLEQIVNGNDLAAVGIINAMLGEGLNSPLYQEVREKKGLVYFIRCSMYKVGNMPLLSISTLTSNENVEEVVDTIAGVLSDPTQHMTAARLETIRKRMDISRQKMMINRYNSIDDFIDPEVRLVQELSQTVTLEQLMTVYNKYYAIDKFDRCTEADLYAKELVSV